MIIRLESILQLIKDYDDNNKDTKYLQGMFQGYIDALYENVIISYVQKIDYENKLSYIVFERHL